MFIRNLAVQNFMIHRDTSLALHPLTVFVGPNNSGKSSMFDALLNFSGICSDPISAAFPTGPFSYRSRHYNGSPNLEPMRFAVDLADSASAEEMLYYEIAYHQTDFVEGQAKYEITDERLVEMPSGTMLFERRDPVATSPEIDEFVDSETGYFAALRKAYFERRLRREGLIGRIASNISRFGKFRLSPALLSRPGQMPDVLPAEIGGRLPQPRMGYQGEGLASLLYFLDRTRDPSFAPLVEGIGFAIDGFEGFEFNALPNGYVGFAARFGDPRGLVEAPNLSAGTLSLIGWLALLYRGDKQPILLLEEPELGLTPRSTRAVYAAAQRAADQEAGANCQVLIATHSPYLMSWASTDNGPESVYRLTPVDGAAETVSYQELPDEPGIGISFDRAMSVEVASQVMHGF